MNSPTFWHHVPMRKLTQEQYYMYLMLPHMASESELYRCKQGKGVASISCIHCLRPNLCLFKERHEISIGDLDEL
ncbi:hypothetical protein DPMN_065554 [Dreissena polymorpha]|uniref:Uncharacterized protein n=1 Tax=Dreissena polymorpha TaxID=45954 RepID=A0A9D4BUA3_DREPO|nr:hypothetical protein DPMN_065554 [Dreissena polymorpha]